MATRAIAPPAQAVATKDFVHAPMSSGRLGSHLFNRFKAFFGPPSQRRLAYAALQVPRVRYWEEEFDRLDDAGLKLRGQQLRGRARGGESLDKLLPEVFGLACTASKRQVGLRPFDVQLAAGVVMHYGALAELATGEGKTLTAILPVALNALTGKGVHVTTVNDYLARRDGEWTGTVYKALGLSVGILTRRCPIPTASGPIGATSPTAPPASSASTSCATGSRPAAAGQATPFWEPWGGNSQFSRPLDPTVQRGHNFALVDEADNIFIDEARTPLIIAAPDPARHRGRTRSSTAGPTSWPARWSCDQHFTYDEKKQKIELTEEGKQLLRWSNPPSGPHSHAMDKLHEHVERALHGHYRFSRDQHYMIEDDEGRHHRRSHRPAHARPPLARGLAPGGRGQGRRADHLCLRPRGPDHLPELLPPLQEAVPA